VSCSGFSYSLFCQLDFEDEPPDDDDSGAEEAEEEDEEDEEDDDDDDHAFEDALESLTLDETLKTVAICQPVSA
jgi:diphthamide biosynthesis protein 3